MPVTACGDNNHTPQNNDSHLLNLRMPNIKPTYFPRAPDHEQSVINLALCNDFKLVKSFDVMDRAILLSDHVPIMATLLCKPLSTITSPPQRYVWNTSRTDIPWDIFQAYLTPYYHNGTTMEPISFPHHPHDST